jgi:hypothetical protein
MTLFTITKLQNQPRCPTTEEWIKKVWCIYTKEFYSAIKISEIMSFAGKWMELEIMLNEISQFSQGQVLHIFSHLWNLEDKNKRLWSKRGTTSDVEKERGKGKGEGGIRKYTKVHYMHAWKFHKELLAFCNSHILMIS